MTFAEVRFNDNLIIFNTVAGPEWQTAITVVNNGREQRNAVWSQPRRVFALDDRPVVWAEAKYILAFHSAMQGMLIAFRLKDALDYQDDGKGIVNPLGIGNGTATGQLHKLYVAGPMSFARKIAKPVDGTVKVYIDGVLSTATVDSTTGIATFPASHATATAATIPSSGFVDLTIAGHAFAMGDSVSIAFSGGTWATINGSYALTVIDSNTVRISANAASLGAFSSATTTSYPQARNALTWTGEFDVPVRFDADKIEFQNTSADRIDWGVLGPTRAFTAKAINLIEVKL